MIKRIFHFLKPNKTKLLIFFFFSFCFFFFLFSKQAFHPFFWSLVYSISNFFQIKFWMVPFIFIFGFLVFLIGFYLISCQISFFQKKKKIIVIFLFAFIFFLPYFLPPSVPPPNEEIKIRGLAFWSALANFDEIKSTGANWVNISHWIEVDWDTGEIIDEKELPKGMNFIKLAHLKNTKKAIKEAKKRGLKVLLQIYPEYFMRDKPFIDTHRFELEHGPVKDQEKFLKEATKTVLKLAKFAKENDVDMFSPWCEMNIFVDWEHTKRWYKEIVPKIREVYDGLLLTPKGEITWKKYKLEPEGDLSFWDFEGYDFVGADVFDNDYSFTTYPGGCKNYQCYREYIRTLVSILEKLKEKSGAKGIILGSEVGLPEQFFALELKRGTKPKEFIEKVWTILFEETKGKVDGYFFYPWKGVQGTGVGNIYFVDERDFLRKYFAKSK